jgi:L-iditol 2-dehydrogenase
VGSRLLLNIELAKNVLVNVKAPTDVNVARGDGVRPVPGEAYDSFRCEDTGNLRNGDEVVELVSGHGPPARLTRRCQMADKKIPEEMLCVVAHGPKDYRLEHRKTPRPGVDELLVKVGACGVCGSDIHAYHGAPSYWGNEKMSAWMKAPVTPGHEFFGEVAELGEGAAEKFAVTVGDRVIAEQIIPCNRCKYCTEGDYHLCMVHNMYGFQKDVAEGAMAEYMRFGSASKVHKIPPNVSLEEAAVIEPLSCSIHAVERASIGLGDFVVVAGAGPIGLFIVQVVHLKTPKKLLVLDVNEKRLETSLALGADLVMNPARRTSSRRSSE